MVIMSSIPATTRTPGSCLSGLLFQEYSVTSCPQQRNFDTCCNWFFRPDEQL